MSRPIRRPVSFLVIDRFKQLPASIRELSRTVRLASSGPGGDVPTLLVHPDWVSPAPAVLWMHGRTANKELDPGRYARWTKTGLATIAIDLPGHGERPGGLGQAPAHELIALALPEIDRVLERLAEPVWQGVFDLDRVAIGGMSLGGMVALRRLCDAHAFKCAAVEGTTGDIWPLYQLPINAASSSSGSTHDQVSPMNPVDHLARFAPIPLLALHSEGDRMVPWNAQLGFLKKLQARYEQAGADPELVQWRTWVDTGAPEEHIGFGRVSNEAKNVQCDFLAARLKPGNS